MDVFVVMGAGVGEDGCASGAMRRRLESALVFGRESSDPVYLVTGGRRGRRPAESDVMKANLQAAGIPADRILVDDQSTDTLSSVTKCAQIIKARNNVRSVMVCSDSYHVPRCRWLFWLLGVPTKLGLMLSGRKSNGTIRWTYYYVREAAAFPVDTLILLLNRFLGRV